MAIWETVSSKISEFIKDPRKAMAIILAGSLFCIFAPESWLKSITIFSFVTQYRDPYIGVALGITSLWFIYDFFVWVYTKIKSYIANSQKKKRDKIKKQELITYFENLSEKERNIIRRYHKFNRNVIRLKLEGEEVFDFINRGLICKVEGLEEDTEVGKYYYFKLNDLIKEFVLDQFAKDVTKENNKQAPKQKGDSYGE